MHYLKEIVFLSSWFSLILAHCFGKGCHVCPFALNLFSPSPTIPYLTREDASPPVCCPDVSRYQCSSYLRQIGGRLRCNCCKQRSVDKQSTRSGTDNEASYKIFPNALLTMETMVNGAIRMMESYDSLQGEHMEHVSEIVDMLAGGAKVSFPAQGEINDRRPC